ncbi:hypothetical protein AB0B45_16890 [Nonomuraea sp. NPDC049152]|uniref:hypothetical protein n=1 Tax=Nonomuraea sp. NPDC049152 TaxID=3154350 RepID=UPI00340C5CD8
MGVACHALHGRAGRWLINEKGMVASAARLETAPDGFAERVAAVFAERVAAVFAEGSVEEAAELIGEARALTG